ncbi:MAG: hypothetical protein ACPHX8_04650, partial [Candidatus Poseidoniaceae archaeon]
MKIVLKEGSSEKSAQAENVHLIEETIILVEEMIENDLIGFVLHAETIILLSEQNAIVVGNQNKGTFRNVAVHSETIVGEEVAMTEEAEMIEEVAMTEEVVIKNSIIEMIGSALRVIMTTFLSELNVINAENLDLEDNPVEETEEVATETNAAEDVEETEEVDSAEDAMAIVEDVEETEEEDSAEDAMAIVEDVEETE